MAEASVSWKVVVFEDGEFVRVRRCASASVWMLRRVCGFVVMVGGVMMGRWRWGRGLTEECGNLAALESR